MQKEAIDIINYITKKTGIDLFSKSREVHNVRVRQVTAFVIKRCTCLTLAKIGEALNCQHSTIINSVNVVEAKIATDNKFCKHFAEIFEHYNINFYNSGKKVVGVITPLHHYYHEFKINNPNELVKWISDQTADSCQIGRYDILVNGKDYKKVSLVLRSSIKTRLIN